MIVQDILVMALLWVSVAIAAGCYRSNDTEPTDTNSTDSNSHDALSDSHSRSTDSAVPSIVGVWQLEAVYYQNGVFTPSVNETSSTGINYIKIHHEPGYDGHGSNYITGRFHDHCCHGCLGTFDSNSVGQLTNWQSDWQQISCTNDACDYTCQEERDKFLFLVGEVTSFEVTDISLSLFNTKKEIDLQFIRGEFDVADFPCMVHSCLK